MHHKSRNKFKWITDHRQQWLILMIKMEMKCKEKIVNIIERDIDTFSASFLTIFKIFLMWKKSDKRPQSKQELVNLFWLLNEFFLVNLPINALNKLINHYKTTVIVTKLENVLIIFIVYTLSTFNFQLFFLLFFIQSQKKVFFILKSSKSIHIHPHTHLKNIFYIFKVKIRTQIVTLIINFVKSQINCEFVKGILYWGDTRHKKTWRATFINGVLYWTAACSRLATLSVSSADLDPLPFQLAIRYSLFNFLHFFLNKPFTYASFIINQLNSGKKYALLRRQNGKNALYSLKIEW